jgi:hypothetical protein
MDDDDDDDDDFDVPVISGSPGTAGMFFTLAPPLPPEEMEQQLAFERRFDEANKPTSYAEVWWWDDRSPRWWFWAVVYAVAAVVDVAIMIAGAAGR